MANVALSTFPASAFLGLLFILFHWHSVSGLHCLSLLASKLCNYSISVMMFNSRYQKDFPEKNVHESSAAVLDFVLDFVLVTPSTPHVLLSIKHDPYPPE